MIIFRWLIVLSFAGPLWAAPAVDSQSALDAMLEKADYLNDHLPDIPAMAETCRHLLDWTESADLLKLPQKSLERWLGAVLMLAPQLGQINRVNDYFTAHADVKKRLTGEPLLRLVHALCTFDSETGHAGDCRKEIASAKDRIQNPGEYLNFHEAKNLYYEGHFQEALENMRAIASRSEKINDLEMVPGIFGVIATMQILEGHLNEAEPFFKKYRQGIIAKKEELNPLYNSSYVPRLESLFLIQEKKYAEAKRSLINLRTAMIKAAKSTPTVTQARIDLLLVAVCKLMKNSKEAGRYHRSLKAAVLHLPSMRHLAVLGDAIIEATFEPAYNQLGAGHPDVKFLDSLMRRQ